MKRKILSFCLIAITTISMTACGGTSTKDTDDETTPSVEQQAALQPPQSDVEMAYMTADETKAILEDDNYVILDVRKAEDFAKGHIPGAIGADMDGYNKGKDFASGVANMTAALGDIKDKNLVLVCYSGKSYAQAATNVLSFLEYDMTKVKTLEGGMKAWEAAYPDVELEK